MKKTYINPAMDIVMLNMDCNILAGSGVTNGSPVGKEFNSEDKSYGRRGFFDDDED